MIYFNWLKQRNEGIIDLRNLIFDSRFANPEFASQILLNGTNQSETSQQTTLKVYPEQGHTKLLFFPLTFYLVSGVH